MPSVVEIKYLMSSSSTDIVLCTRVASLENWDMIGFVSASITFRIAKNILEKSDFGFTSCFFAVLVLTVLEISLLIAVISHRF